MISQSSNGNGARNHRNHDHQKSDRAGGAGLLDQVDETSLPQKERPWNARKSPEKKHRVLVWGINYGPEVTGIGPYNVALCEYLRKQGHDVEMLTAFCYYPAWSKLPEDRRQAYRTDYINGVRVRRCWNHVPQKVSAKRRIIHELSFMLTSMLRALLGKRPDVMVVVSPPLLLGVAAWVVSSLRGVPFIFHVQDLQPDAAIALGMLKQNWMTQILWAFEDLVYRKASRVSGISAGILKAFMKKGVPREKRVYFPNGVVLPDAAKIPKPGAFRKRLGIKNGGMIAVYSGNLGVKQGLPVLLDAAAKCRDPGMHIVICGNGAERASLARQVAERGLGHVHLLPLQERKEYEEMLVDADLCLITQLAGTGQFFFPSKLLTTLAYRRPVLAVADAGGDLAAAVREARCGVCVAPGNPDALARALEDANRNREALAEMGQRGYEYVQRFEMDRVLGDFELVLNQVVEEEKMHAEVPAEEVPVQIGAGAGGATV